MDGLPRCALALVMAIVMALPVSAVADKVKITEEETAYLLENDQIAVRVPRAAKSTLPAPVLGLRPVGGKWLGTGQWRTALKLSSFSVKATGGGDAAAVIRFRYDFEPTPATTKPYAEFQVTLRPDEPLVSIEEEHTMAPGDAWVFESGAGWKPNEGIIRGWLHSKGPHEVPDVGPDPRVVPLLPSPRLGETLAYLQPRWTQNCDAAWCFAATDDTTVLYAIPARLSKWLWPYDNLIEVRTDKTGNVASLVCPTAKGRRFFLLAAGPKALMDRTKEIASRYSAVGFAPFSSGINPSGGGIRGPGRRLAAEIKSGKVPKTTIAQVRDWFSPDRYGLYYNHWSPINPNFATDYLKVGILMAVGCRDNPEARKLAEEAFRMDLEHSVTLPGGAGQECPGYLMHALDQWIELAPICKEYLGFDPRDWPHMKAAATFLLHTKPPKGRILPMGDTHPRGGDVLAVARALGVDLDLTQLKTEELPGFGVVFRGDGAWMAFKAGPNRGHMHGDQLSFHGMGCVDHMCSYAPRADQEHMHNRVAFAPLDWDYANMDGHERLIAFRTSPTVDVAIGQVEVDAAAKATQAPACSLAGPVREESL